MVPAPSLTPFPMPFIDSTATVPSADRLVLAALPAAVLVLDPLGIVRDANPSAERIFARPTESLRGGTIDRLLSLSESSRIGGSIAAWLRERRGQDIEALPDCRGRTPDGTEFSCDVTLAPLVGPGAPGRWVLQVDETSRREFQSVQRHESAKMAAVATLAAGIANDFNNTLAAISGSIEAARLRIVSQDRVPPRELIEAKEATRAAARLVRRLLNFARPSPAVRRTLNPRLLIEDAAQVLQRDLDPRISLVTRLDHADWNIRADLEQLTDLIVSLGANAVDAMPAGGILTLATARVAAGAWGADGPATVDGREFVRIEIRDTGTGIPAEVLPRIFEPFFTTKEAGRGSGLGLATAYAVLRQHDAGITVESAIGTGSIFQLFLPRTQDALLASPPGLSLRPGTGTGNILLVDDEAAVRRPLRQALGLCGYSVAEARDGLEALRLHGEPGTRVDLVVLDVKMPGMSGWDVLSELKRRDPRLPVILTSGYTQQDSQPPANPTEPDAYLPKPYDLAELMAQVHRFLPRT